VTAVIGYRVFAPGEIRSPAQTAAYPTASPEAELGVTSELWRTPLLIDDHLRVYAAQRQVWADGPINARTEMTAFWSFRRWPQEVTGVVAVERVVVSRWDDGEIVALDSRTGEVSWRVNGPLDPQRDEVGYTGRRTGALTVYDATNLFSVRGRSGAAVVIVESRTEARAYAAATGRELWSEPFGPDCTPGWTGAGFYARPCSHLILRDAWTGDVAWSWRPEGAGRDTSEGPTWTAVPVGCEIGRSECRAIRTRDPASRTTVAWLLDGPGESRDDGGSTERSWPTEAPVLAVPGAWLAGDVVVNAPGPTRELIGRSVHTGQVVWRWTGGSYTDTSPVRVVAATPDALGLLSEKDSFIALDPRTGQELGRFSLDKWRNIGASSPTWKAGHVYTRGRYVVVERLLPDGDQDDDDNAYYYSLRSVLIAGW
jgi:outer membrane protein assembly factor BamB